MLIQLRTHWRSFLTITIAAAIWLCPLWLIPTAIVPSLLWAATALGWLLILDAKPHPIESERIALQKVFILLLVSLALVIAWRSPSPQNALAASLSLISIGLAATLTAKADATRPAALFAWAWLLAGLCNAAYGLIQYCGWTDEPVGMAFGFLRQRNNFATLCNMALVALIYLWHQKKLETKLALAAGLLLSSGLAATISRAGLLGFVAIVLLMCVQKNLRKAAVGLVVAYSFFAWTLPPSIQSSETIVARVSSTTDGGQLQDTRRIMWHNTLVVIREQPLLGVGWRELDRALHLADFGTQARFPGQVDNAHNLPLQFAAELGVPFTALWLLGVLWLVLRNKPWQTKAPEALLAWGVLLVMAIHSMLEYPLWYAPFQIATGLAAGLIFSQKKAAGNAAVCLIPYGLAGSFAGIGLIVFSSYAAFDYHRVRQLFIPVAERSSFYLGRELPSAEQSWLFAAQVRYARLSAMRHTNAHPAEVYALAQEVLHMTAEPWVLQTLISSGEKLAASNSALAADVAIYKQRLSSILATDEAAGLPTLK